MTESADPSWAAYDVVPCKKCREYPNPLLREKHLRDYSATIECVPCQSSVQVFRDNQEDADVEAFETWNRMNRKEEA